MKGYVRKNTKLKNVSLTLVAWGLAKKLKAHINLSAEVEKLIINLAKKYNVK